MVRQEKSRLGIFVVTTFWLLATTAQAETQTLSQQLLRSYFDTAGVCTTSQVSHIRDDGETITIEIVIEPNTRMNVERMQNPERDNWFSLHCPPEIHGVWRQQSPPSDILVTGLVSDNESYTLSCVAFQSKQWDTRELRLRDKIQRWLEEKLES